jgi:pilus assembly protein CpaB
MRRTARPAAQAARGGLPSLTDLTDLTGLGGLTGLAGSSGLGDTEAADRHRELGGEPAGGRVGWPRRGAPWSPRRRALLRLRARRVAAAVAAGFAVWLGLGAVLPPAPPAGVPVLVAARDLPAGHRIGDGDVQLRPWPAELVPTGAVTGTAELASTLGREVVGPVRAGEALTDARLLSPGLLTGLLTGTSGEGPGGAAGSSAAVAVPLADWALVPSLRPGDRVRVLVPGTGQVVAEGPVLLAEPPADGSLGQARAGRLLLGLSSSDVVSLVAARPVDGSGLGGGGFVAALVGAS